MTFSLPKEMDERVAALAARAHLSKNIYLLELLEESLQDREDYLKALELSEKIARGEEKTSSFDEVLANLGLTRSDLH